MLQNWLRTVILILCGITQRKTGHLNDVPNAGEVFVGCDTEKEARSFADTFIAQNKVKLIDDTKSKMSLDDLFNQIQAGNVKELNIIVKTDVQGSVEAVKQSLVKLSQDGDGSP